MDPLDGAHGYVLCVRNSSPKPGPVIANGKYFTRAHTLQLARLDLGQMHTKTQNYSHPLHQSAQP